MSVSERQRLRLCGQDHCGAFVRLYWQPTSKRAIVQWRPTAQQQRLYLYHQGEFQHQNCTVGTVHDSDHEGVVRIFVRHSYHSNELFTLINYAAQFFLYQECNKVIIDKETRKQGNKETRKGTQHKHIQCISRQRYLEVVPL